MQLSKTNENAQRAALDIARIAGYMWQKGWAEGSGGNISVNVTEHYTGIQIDFRTYPMIALKKKYPSIAGNYIFLTTKGSRMRTVAEEPSGNICLIKVSQAGDAYQLLFEDKDKPGEPSSELPSHLAIHDLMVRRGQGEKAAVHAHSNEVVALTHIPGLNNEKKINEVLFRMHTETVWFLPGGVGYIPFRIPGTEEMATSTLDALENHNVVIWEKHGCLALGKDVDQAFDFIDMLSKAASVYLHVKASGHEPEGLTDDQLKDLRGPL